MNRKSAVVGLALLAMLLVMVPVPVTYSAPESITVPAGVFGYGALGYVASSRNDTISVSAGVSSREYTWRVSFSSVTSVTVYNGLVVPGASTFKYVDVTFSTAGVSWDITVQESPDGSTYTTTWSRTGIAGTQRVTVNHVPTNLYMRVILTFSVAATGSVESSIHHERFYYSDINSMYRYVVPRKVQDGSGAPTYVDDPLEITTSIRVRPRVDGWIDYSTLKEAELRLSLPSGTYRIYIGGSAVDPDDGTRFRANDDLRVEYKHTINSGTGQLVGFASALFAALTQREAIIDFSNPNTYTIRVRVEPYITVSTGAPTTGGSSMLIFSRYVIPSGSPIIESSLGVSSVGLGGILYSGFGALDKIITHLASITGAAATTTVDVVYTAEGASSGYAIVRVPMQSLNARVPSPFDIRLLAASIVLSEEMIFPFVSSPAPISTQVANALESNPLVNRDVLRYWILDMSASPPIKIPILVYLRANGSVVANFVRDLQVPAEGRYTYRFLAIIAGDVSTSDPVFLSRTAHLPDMIIASSDDSPAMHVKKDEINRLTIEVDYLNNDTHREFRGLELRSQQLGRTVRSGEAITPPLRFDAGYHYFDVVGTDMRLWLVTAFFASGEPYSWLWSFLYHEATMTDKKYMLLADTITWDYPGEMTIDSSLPKMVRINITTIPGIELFWKKITDVKPGVWIMVENVKGRPVATLYQGATKLAKVDGEQSRTFIGDAWFFAVPTNHLPLVDRIEVKFPAVVRLRFLSPSDKPIADAQVRLEHTTGGEVDAAYTGRTDQNGVVSFSSVEPFTTAYRVTITQGQNSETRTIEIRDDVDAVIHVNFEPSEQPSEQPPGGGDTGPDMTVVVIIALIAVGAVIAFMLMRGGGGISKGGGRGGDEFDVYFEI